VGVAAWAVVTCIGGVAADHHPGDGGVAGQPPAGLGFQGAGPADVPTQPAQPTLHALAAVEAVQTVEAVQAVQVDEHAQLGPDPTRLGQLARFQCLAGQFFQGIGGALAPAAGVVVVSRAGQGVQGGLDGVAGLGAMVPWTTTIPSMVTLNQTPWRW
jgi:hypothetical protein